VRGAKHGNAGSIEECIRDEECLEDLNDDWWWRSERELKDWAKRIIGRSKADDVILPDASKWT
jgi:hypothetical protein